MKFDIEHWKKGQSMNRAMKSLLMLTAGCCCFGAAMARESPTNRNAHGGAWLCGTPIKRVGGPSLKVSLNAYSFNQLLNDHIKGRGKGITLMELLDFCAENNFDAIDPTGTFPRLSQGAQ